MKCQDCNNVKKVHQYFLKTPQVVGAILLCDECAEKMSAAASRDRGMYFARNQAVSRYDIADGSWVPIPADWDL